MLRQSKEHQHKGFTIYRTSDHSNAYNPWKISCIKGGFPTLAAAKKHIDAKHSANQESAQ